jgi:dTDP-4-amino-4,6-dideoxy-D-glucose acyltransferase
MKLGRDVVISSNVDIRYPDSVMIRDHVAIDSYFCCSTQLLIKNYVHIGPSVSIIGGKNAKCEIGNFSGMAAGCRIICTSDEYLGEGLICPFVPKKYQDKKITGGVVLEAFVTLGTNVVVFPNVRLGEGSVVAAGSIVTKNTQPWTIYAGHSARPIGTRPKDKMLAYAKELGYGA